jgi:hypothetical protein
MLGELVMLKQFYDVQTEIPAALQEHYTEHDGKWMLQLDPPVEDVTGLKSALNQERTLRREADRSLSEFKIHYQGIDPEEVQKLRERVKGLDDADIYDKQGLDALVVRRTESMKNEHERLLRQKDAEIGTLRDNVSVLDRRWRQDRIKTALVDAAVKAGVAKYALADAVTRGMAVFTDLDDHGTVVARDGEDLRYGKDGIHPLTPDEWMTNLKQDAPHFWPPSAGGGAPVHHTGSGAHIDWNALPPTERLTRFREWQAAQGQRG